MYRACLVALVDRKSRFAVGGKVDKKNAREVSRVIICALRGLPVKTITPDRGMEFARNTEVTSALQVPFYFPPPHQPWQRETNENTNGLLREYVPKGQDLTDISQERIQEVFDELNVRPRKFLGLDSSLEDKQEKPDCQRKVNKKPPYVKEETNVKKLSQEVADLRDSLDEITESQSSILHILDALAEQLENFLWRLRDGRAGKERTNQGALPLSFDGRHHLCRRPLDHHPDGGRTCCIQCAAHRGNWAL